MGATPAQIERRRAGAPEADACALARRALLALGAEAVGAGGCANSDDDGLTRPVVERLMRSLLRRAEGAGDEPGSHSEGIGSIPTNVATLERVYESLLGVGLVTDADDVRLARSPARRRAGSFYTPAPVVEHLLDSALEPVVAERLDGCASALARERAILEIAVCDPACGSGRFLVGAARRLALHLARVRAEDPAAGHRAMRDVVSRCVYGVDLDPIGVELCRLALAREADVGPRTLERAIRVGNGLLGTAGERGTREAADSWCAKFFGAQGEEEVRRVARDHALFHWWLELAHVGSRGGFDVVVGNPPFLSQLATDTAASRAEAALLREASGGVVRGYSDMASAFLWRSMVLTRDGGRVALVQPLSVLSARDAGRVLAWVARFGTLTHLWMCRERVFRAGVSTCAPTIRKGGARRASVRRTTGPAFHALPDAEVDMDELAAGGAWAPLIAPLWGVPPVEVGGCGKIGDVADATADFRDEYYGLRGAIVEDDGLDEASRARSPALVTSGLIDLARCRWGIAPTRIHKRCWSAPRVDAARLDEPMAMWLGRRLVPKVLVATQTRVIEVVVDETGALAPVTPTISVTPTGASIWHVAAALASPVSCAVALTRHAGAGMSPHAIKLSARQVLALPLPRTGASWDAGASALREASQAPDERTRLTSLRAMGERMVEASAVAEGPALLAWWLGRLVPDGRRRGGPTTLSA